MNTLVLPSRELQVLNFKESGILLTGLNRYLRCELPTNRWVEPRLCKRLTRIDRDWLWISIFLALSTSYIFVLVIEWKCFSPDFPQFFHMSGFEDVRMSGCPDIETLTRDLETFFRSQGQFWVKSGQEWRNSSCSSVRISLIIFQVQVLKFCDFIFIFGLN